MSFLTQEQRNLSRKKKGSSNWNKQRVRVAKVQEKIANQRKNFLHHKSKEIVTTYDAVIIEDLDMKGLSQALKFGKSVSDNGWGMFTAFLHDKLNEQGKKLVKIDKWFPSSKTCSGCGGTQPMPMTIRTYDCLCGLTLGRDINVALTIKKRDSLTSNYPKSPSLKKPVREEWWAVHKDDRLDGNEKNEKK